MPFNHKTFSLLCTVKHAYNKVPRMDYFTLLLS